MSKPLDHWENDVAVNNNVPDPEIKTEEYYKFQAQLKSQLVADQIFCAVAGEIALSEATKQSQHAGAGKRLKDSALGIVKFLASKRAKWSEEKRIITISLYNGVLSSPLHNKEMVVVPERRSLSSPVSSSSSFSSSLSSISSSSLSSSSSESFLSRKVLKTMTTKQSTLRMKQGLSENDLNYFEKEFKNWTKESKKFYVHPTKKEIRLTNQGQVMNYILTHRHEKKSTMK